MAAIADTALGKIRPEQIRPDLGDKIPAIIQFEGDAPGWILLIPGPAGNQGGIRTIDMANQHGGEP